MSTETNDSTSKIHVRGSTRRKLDVIAQHKRWKLVEVVEQATDALIEKEGISISPAPAQTKRRSRRHAA